MVRWRGVVRGIIAVLIAQGISWLASRNPSAVERWYARGLYPPIGRLLSRFTSLVPFSLAEMGVVLLLLTAVVGVLYWLVLLWRQPRRWLRQVRMLLTVGLFAYAGFISLWGLNYYRQPLAVIMQLDVQPTAADELAELCSDLLQQANELRQHLAEDENRVMQLSGGKWRALGRAQLGYDALAQQLPQVGGRYGPPKGVRLSHWWSYTGTAGMYIPFTGEAHVNMAMPDYNLPAVACHEMAHQRGFAREDEANFLAYLACLYHPDPEFQYSGLMLALSQSMRALSRVAPDAFAALRAEFGPGLVRDLEANQTFWLRFSGPMEKLSERMNDAYLKSNRQSDGVQSYGRMVDLLLAARRASTLRR